MRLTPFRFAAGVPIAAALLLAAATAGAQDRTRIDALTPVTDAMLQDPEPEDWLNWRRTLDGQGHSPLDQITAENVDRLRLAWSWGMAPGSQQTTPIVHDGVMFLANPGEMVQALDAATGELIWTYRRDEVASATGAAAPVPGRPHRSIAIYEDRIYLNTSDGHVVAIDARTGAEAWDTDVTQGATFQFTSGSIVADGRIVAGMTGCGVYQDDTCYIVGLDAATGEEAWRTSTIARPGDRGGDTWGDLPLMFRAGSDSWIPGSYDPVTKTLFHGTSQAKPWATVVRGTDGDALYTNSTLALDPATGEMKWYFQHLPAESLDMDEVFEAHPRRLRRATLGLHDGQDGGALGARPRDGGVPQRTRPRLPDLRRRRSRNRRRDLSRRNGPRAVRGGLLVPEHVRLQELEGDVVPPRARSVLHPD